MTLIAGACMAAPPSHQSANQPSAPVAAPPPTGIDPVEEGRQLRLRPGAREPVPGDRCQPAACRSSTDTAAKRPASTRSAAGPRRHRSGRRRAGPHPAGRRRSDPYRSGPCRSGRLRRARRGHPTPFRGRPRRPSGAVGAVVAFALAQVGKPYQHARSGPDGFDCSGLAQAAYARIGISLPHQTRAIAARGRPVSRADLRPGDLVFTGPGHVGIYIGGGQMVHASTRAWRREAVAGLPVRVRPPGRRLTAAAGHGPAREGGPAGGDRRRAARDRNGPCVGSGLRSAGRGWAAGTGSPVPPDRPQWRMRPAPSWPCTPPIRRRCSCPCRPGCAGATVAAIERALYEERTLIRLLAMRRTMFVAPVETAPVLQAGGQPGGGRSAAPALRQAAGRLPGRPAGRRSRRLARRRRATARCGRWPRAARRPAPSCRPTSRGCAPRCSWRRSKSYGGPQSITSWVLNLLALDGRIVRGAAEGILDQQPVALGADGDVAAGRHRGPAGRAGPRRAGAVAGSRRSAPARWPT